MSPARSALNLAIELHDLINYELDRMEKEE
jgi:hypothetical protein